MLNHWLPYLSPHSIKKIENFVDDTKNNIVRKKILLLCGSEYTKLNRMMKEVQNLVGDCKNKLICSECDSSEAKPFVSHFEKIKSSDYLVMICENVNILPSTYEIINFDDQNIYNPSLDLTILGHWIPYLSSKSITQIVNFIDDTKKNIPREKILVFYGGGCTGKSTMAEEVRNIVGKDKCYMYYNDVDIDMENDIYNTDKLIIANLEDVSTTLALKKIFEARKKSRYTVPLNNYLVVTCDPDLVREMSTVCEIVNFYHHFKNN